MVDVQISYDGCFPNLCSGTLKISINGTLWQFPQGCMKSGGGVSFNKHWEEHVSHGPWEITEWPDDFPDEYKECTLEEVNEIVRHGCCGGCV